MTYRKKYRVYVKGEFRTETNRITEARAIVDQAGDGNVWDDYQGCIVYSI